MAIYFVQGKLGSGKSLACVGKIRDALIEGRRVATNLDIYTDKMFTMKRRYTLTRLPDKPSVADLELIGTGNDVMDESKNGLIVLDEMASYMNARSYQDKGRADVIDWLIHSRKLGWDVIFIAPGIELIDKQVRGSLVEFLVTCRRLDRLKIPFLGSLLKHLSLPYHMPKIHIGIVRYGTDANAIVADRWMYMARNLYPAYNTRQTFINNYPHGTHSILSAWHLVGRYDKSVSMWKHFRRFAGLDDVPREKPVTKPSPTMEHIASNRRLSDDEKWRAAKLLAEDVTFRISTPERLQ